MRCFTLSRGQRKHQSSYELIIFQILGKGVKPVRGKTEWSEKALKTWTIRLCLDCCRGADVWSHPAKMQPMSEMNHSGELNPRMPTPWKRSNPSCEEKEQCAVITPCRRHAFGLNRVFRAVKHETWPKLRISHAQVLVFSGTFSPQIRH